MVLRKKPSDRLSGDQKGNAKTSASGDCPVSSAYRTPDPQRVLAGGVTARRTLPLCPSGDTIGTSAPDTPSGGRTLKRIIAARLSSVVICERHKMNKARAATMAAAAMAARFHQLRDLVIAIVADRSVEAGLSAYS